MFSKGILTTSYESHCIKEWIVQIYNMYRRHQADKFSANEHLPNFPHEQVAT